MCAHVQECHCASVAVSEHVLSFHHVGSETELVFSGLVPLHTEASRQFKGFLKNKTKQQTHIYFTPSMHFVPQHACLGQDNLWALILSLGATELR